MKNFFAFLFVGAMAISCAQTSKKTTATDAKDTKAKTTAAATATKASAGATECKSGTDVRNIEVKATASGTEVVYTKFGEAKSIATGGKEHCDAIKNRVVGNLEKSGYTCK